MICANKSSERVQKGSAGRAGGIVGGLLDVSEAAIAPASSSCSNRTGRAAVVL